MKKLIRDYLTFNKRERNGILFLSFLLLVMILINLFQGYFIPEQPPIDTTAFQADIARFRASIAAAKQDSIEKRRRSFETFEEEEEQQAISYFPFDPNTATEKELSQLGLKDWQIKIIAKYRSKGGQFRVRKDLAKIYGINASLYAQLEPHITLPDTLERKKYTSKKWPERPKARNWDTVQVAINGADTNRLKALKGVGAYRAKRIAKYRDKLGGFYSYEQLYEVWGLDSATVDGLRANISLDTNRVRQININTASQEELKSHPYISWKLAQVIVNYRKQHGPFPDVRSVMNTDLVNGDLYVKIAPYLKVLERADHPVKRNRSGDSGLPETRDKF